MDPAWSKTVQDPSEVESCHNTFIILSTVIFTNDTWNSKPAFTTVFHTPCLWSILKISRNNKIQKIVEMENLQGIVKRRCRQFSGHVLGLKEERLSHEEMGIRKGE